MRTFSHLTSEERVELPSSGPLPHPVSKLAQKQHLIFSGDASRWRSLILLMIQLLSLIQAAPLWASGSLPGVVKILPPLGILAPQNTHVLIYFPPNWSNWYFGEASKMVLSAVDVKVRSIRSHEEVTCDKKQHFQLNYSIIELTPARILDPGDYEVLILNELSYIAIGQFTIGEYTDKDAPKFLQTSTPSYEERYRLIAEASGKTICELSNDDTLHDIEATGLVPRVKFQNFKVSDNKTPSELLIWAIWFQVDDLPIEYTAPPSVFIFPGKVPFIFPSAFSELEIDLRIIWQGSKCETLSKQRQNLSNLKIGIRIVDFAGNYSTPWESPVVYLDKPGKPLRIKPEHLAGQINGLPKYSRTSSKALAPFQRAIQRSSANNNWKLAFEQCMFAWSRLAVMPIICQEISAKLPSPLQIPFHFKNPYSSPSYIQVEP